MADGVGEADFDGGGEPIELGCGVVGAGDGPAFTDEGTGLGVEGAVPVGPVDAGGGSGKSPCAGCVGKSAVIGSDLWRAFD